MNMMTQINPPAPHAAENPSADDRSLAVLGATGLALVALTYASWTSYRTLPPPPLPIAAGAIDEQVQQLQALPQADRAAAVSAQQQRLSGEPLDRTALYNLAQLYAAQGETAASERLVMLSSSRSLRDIEVQASTLQVLLRKGELAKAMLVMDSLARSRPQLQETLFDQLKTLATTREGEPHVNALLASAPPWRTAFFSRLVKTNADAQLVYRLLAALKGSESPATDGETRLLLGRLVKDKQYATGYFIWLDLLDEIDLRRVAHVFDSGFDTTSRNLYFDWTFARSKTVEVRIVPRATGSADKVLRIDYVGNREAVTAAYQYLRLPPGEYVLSGEQRADGLKTDSGILWRISCVEGGGGSLAAAPRLTDDMQWSRFDIRFSVPQNCQSQLLHLNAASVAALDQQISGSAQFDNLNVTPLAPNP